MPRQSQESDSDSLHSILLLNLGHLRAVIVQKMILESNHNKINFYFLRFTQKAHFKAVKKVLRERRTQS